MSLFFLLLVCVDFGGGGGGIFVCTVYIMWIYINSYYVLFYKQINICISTLT